MKLGTASPGKSSALCQAPWNAEVGLGNTDDTKSSRADFRSESVAQPAPRGASCSVHGKLNPSPNSQEWLNQNLCPVFSSLCSWVADYGPSTPELVTHSAGLARKDRRQDSRFSRHVTRPRRVYLEAHLPRPHYLLYRWTDRGLRYWTNTPIWTMASTQSHDSETACVRLEHQGHVKASCTYREIFSGTGLCCTGLERLNLLLKHKFLCNTVQMCSKELWQEKHALRINIICSRLAVICSNLALPWDLEAEGGKKEKNRKVLFPKEIHFWNQALGP